MYLSQTTKKIAVSALIAMLILSANSVVCAAAPAKHKGDYFGRSTNSAPPSAKSIFTNEPHPAVSTASTPIQWFAAFDDYMGFYRPSEVDKYIMSQNFNQEVERVMDFCKTTKKVEIIYRTLSQRLHSMPIPLSLPEAREYRDLCSNWYLDSAQLYEDMIRPRPAARTKEELDSMLQEITDRSESLKLSRSRLLVMDSNLRRKYSINPPKYDDALFQYYNKSKPH